jgi:hypothetical protein
LALFVAIGVLLRSARFKGFFGEFRVRATVRLRLGGRTYRSLHNLTFPTGDGTTQIDHVIASRFGIFVIETKNLKGWIFGDEKSRRWTQSIYGKKYQFQNPLRQNYKHLKAVQALVELDARCLHSVVVFVGSCKFKTRMPSNVLKRRRLVRYIRSKTEVLLADEEVEHSLEALQAVQISTFGARRRHIRSLKKNRREPVCPRCGNAMVLRTARKGRGTGSSFWGCSNFPRCRVTKDAV